MNRPYYADLDSVPKHVRAEYAKHAYKFSAPYGPSSAWTATDWINYVTFNNLDPITHEVLP